MKYLQPYKGKDTRHDCPSCKAKLSFTQYLDGNTHKPIHDNVGKCNRESKCGYHYTPKQYFIDNILSPSPVERAGVRSLTPPFGGGWVGSKPIELPCSIGTIPFRFVERSASYKSNFVRFLCEILTEEQIHSIGEHYALGATKNKEVIFWQIDIHGKVRTGKIMQYNPTTGKRLKHQSGGIDWTHNKLKKSKELPEDFNLQKCFFGEHLLKIYPNKQVAIVESKKLAIIASCIVPDLIWLAAGNLNGLSLEKCQVLKERKVTLFPDLGGFEKWRLKAEELQKQGNCKITVSTLLEDEATETERQNGLNIADYIIAVLKPDLSSRKGAEAKEIPNIQSPFTQELEQMIITNPTLLILIDNLQLVQI